MAAGKRDLTNEERECILREVLLHSKQAFMMRLPKGLCAHLAAKYNCHVSSIRRVLSRAKSQGIQDGNMRVCVKNRKKGRVGRKMAHSPAQVKQKLLDMPLELRGNLRMIATNTGIIYGSLHRYLKLGMFRSHTNSIRPQLTPANKYSRLKFALGFVRPSMEISEMLEYVHLDEKWFYLTHENIKFYLVPGEKEPDWSCQSKRFITKVMFLTAVARPRFCEDTGLWFNGKIGTWPFIELAEAKRSSVNRPAGTLETKVVVVTKDVYRS
ncbi:hypothetical protein Ae201684_012664 [Aphanomyces euteiches]|uniref:Transposase Tc1-like domain-containing protein n=1 Tax=Aphanomyces euteiches TaxID=100861 RepID=A0A6G0WQV3_9STRA|nr:hypothetical protein Ae201684_012664 [Aphanomyces euteiches]